jgi:hypothetical protein
MVTQNDENQWPPKPENYEEPKAVRTKLWRFVPLFWLIFILLMFGAFLLYVHYIVKPTVGNGGRLNHQYHRAF